MKHWQRAYINATSLSPSSTGHVSPATWFGSLRVPSEWEATKFITIKFVSCEEGFQLSGFIQKSFDIWKFLNFCSQKSWFPLTLYMLHARLLMKLSLTLEPNLISNLHSLQIGTSPPVGYLLTLSVVGKLTPNCKKRAC